MGQNLAPDSFYFIWPLGDQAPLKDSVAPNPFPIAICKNYDRGLMVALKKVAVRFQPERELLNSERPISY
jgi:hypothetical protein